MGKIAVLAASAGLSVLMTGCTSSDMASYDTPGSPKSRLFETGEVNRINPDEDYVYNDHYRRYEYRNLHSERYYSGVGGTGYMEDRAGTRAPQGFMYDDRDRLVPIDRFLTESDRRLNHRIRDAIESRRLIDKDNISLTTVNGDVTVHGWVPNDRVRQKIENRIRDIAGPQNVTFDLAS